MATCPECEFDELDSSELEEGDTLSCPECGSHLVLNANDELEFADEDDDDDLDDDDDEDEDEDEEDDDDELDEDDELVDDEDE